jgi:hypothetical protein
MKGSFTFIEVWCIICMSVPFRMGMVWFDEHHQNECYVCEYVLIFEKDFLDQ